MRSIFVETAKYHTRLNNKNSSFAWTIFNRLPHLPGYFNKRFPQSKRLVLDFYPLCYSFSPCRKVFVQHSSVAENPEFIGLTMWRLTLWSFSLYQISCLNMKGARCIVSHVNTKLSQHMYIRFCHFKLFAPPPALYTSAGYDHALWTLTWMCLTLMKKGHFLSTISLFKLNRKFDPEPPPPNCVSRPPCPWSHTCCWQRWRVRKFRLTQP